MDDIDEQIQVAVQTHMRRYDMVLELVCEAALEEGEHGVLVVWEGASFTISVEPDVPYGEIHERWRL